MTFNVAILKSIVREFVFLLSTTQDELFYKKCFLGERYVFLSTFWKKQRELNIQMEQIFKN